MPLNLARENESLSKSIYSVDARFLSDTHGRDFACYGNGASEFDRHQFGYHHQEVQEESKEGKGGGRKKVGRRGQGCRRRYDSHDHEEVAKEQEGSGKGRSGRR